MSKRWLVILIAVVAIPATVYGDSATPERAFGTPITVYKSPTCGCCAGWADYLRDNGFRVTVVDRYDMDSIKLKYGVTPQLQSCHTAVVGGYVIEGHVPADDIWRLLSERPDVAGLSAPGMPSMSPGMMSIVPRGYDVLSFDREGRVATFSRY